MHCSAVARVTEQHCFNSTPDPYNDQTAIFVLKPPKVIESRTYVKKANLDCYWNNNVLYYSGDNKSETQYDWGKLGYSWFFLSAPVQAASGCCLLTFKKELVAASVEVLEKSLIFKKYSKRTLTLMSNYEIIFWQ